MTVYRTDSEIQALFLGSEACQPYPVSLLPMIDEFLVESGLKPADPDKEFSHVDS